MELDSMIGFISENEYQQLYFQSKAFNINKIQGWKGFQIAQINTTIFESAKMSGVFNELNISTIRLIAGTYEAQKIYSELGRQSLNRLLEMDSNTKVIDVIGILQRLVKYDIFNMEQELLKKLENSKLELNKILNNKTFKK
ncbi:MAG: hypothetical protein HC831_06070 [Chloroflexia bacterium]|nr:hypothetical protein [Chloroflexia bacterium]